MKRILALKLLTALVLSIHSFTTIAQDEARAAWQVTKFDLNADVQQSGRTLAVTAGLAAINVGGALGSTFTFRIHTKATIKSVTVGGANASFRSVPETRGNVQRVTVNLPASVSPNGALNLTISYALPVESNTGLTAIAPMGSQFLPLSAWYPSPNTQFTLRGADTAPFTLRVNATNIISSGLEKSATGSTVYEQSLNAFPFFVQGDWDKIGGTKDSGGISAYIPKGASPEEQKQAAALVDLTAQARTFFTGFLGAPPDVPIRIVSVRRGAGFNDAGTILLESGAFRRSKIDSTTASLLAESVSRIWLGGQTAIHGEGSGVLREGLARFLALLFLEKQFGREASNSELLRVRLAYSSVAKRDSPLSRSTPLDDTYFGSVPNKGAMVWRLVDRQLGREVFMTLLRESLQAGKERSVGISLASLRATLNERGGDALKALLDQLFDQVTDTDLMIGLPQQRGSTWVSALRNLGSIDVRVTVTATTDRGEKLSVDSSIPARNFGEAVFNTTSKILRAEVDPEKLYPQLEYGNDVSPKMRDIPDSMAEASRLFGAQDYIKAADVARDLLNVAPHLQEGRIVLGRALLGQNKLDEAETVFRSALDEALPSPSTLAWANIGLGEIAFKRGQNPEAIKRFNDAVAADAEYASSLVARAGRIKAESTDKNGPPVDESARAFITQLDQVITSGKQAELESRIVSGELTRFISGIVGSQPEVWQTRVLRTQQLGANLLAADVMINAKELGREQSGTALLILARDGSNWKLNGVELFELK